MKSEEKSILAQQIDTALIEAILNCREVNELFELARHYGLFHWMNKTGRWENPELENHIFRLLEPHMPPFWAAKERTVISHVISECYDIGGHTPLCVNIMKEQKRLGDDVQFVITRSATPKVIGDVKSSDISVIPPAFSGLGQLFFLAQTFLQSKVVVLYIHPDDIIACIAAMIAEREGVHCYFVNHANIHFSYGLSQCTSVLEMDGYSWLCTEQFRSPKKQSFLGIPCSKVDTASVGSEVSDSEISEPYFISVGSQNKYRLDQSTMFSDFVEILCGEFNQKLKLIAPVDYSQFPHLSQKARNNLEILGVMERDKTLALMAKAKAYIDSFPEGGGTSVTNAMRLGLPIFGCRPPGGFYGEDFLSQTLEELVDAVRRFLDEGTDNEKLERRAQFIGENFSVSACVDRLIAAINGDSVSIPFHFDENLGDLTYYEKKWLEQEDMYIPSIVKVDTKKGKVRVIAPNYVYENYIGEQAQSATLLNQSRIRHEWEKLPLHTSALCMHEQSGVSLTTVVGSMLNKKAETLPSKTDKAMFVFNTAQAAFEQLQQEAVKNNDTSLTSQQQNTYADIMRVLGFELTSEVKRRAQVLKAEMQQWKLLHDYQRWINNHALQEIDAQLHAERMMKWLEQPKFHFVLFLADEERHLLADTIDSLGRQFYKNWKLSIIADGAAPDPIFDEVEVLEWVRLPEGEADLYKVLNDVCFASDADWFGYIPAGTQFAPQMMLQFGDYINKYQHQMAYYCDDDLIKPGTEERYNPRFKPDFNLDMLRSSDYIGTLLCQREVFIALGGFDVLPGHEGMGLAFKIIERLGLNSIGHISDVLIHLPETVLQQRHRAVMKQAVAQHLHRLSISAEVTDGLTDNAVRVHYQWQESPLVSIIIPTKDKLEFLRPCVESVLSKTDYSNYELIVVDNRSEDPDAQVFLNSLNVDYGDKVRVLKYPHPFNYAAIGNMAAKEARGDYLLFLNNDTEVLHGEWLSRMMSHAQREEVGVVGARLIFPETGLLQHAGVVLGMGGWCANHINMESLHIDEAGYMERAHLEQNFSAVTGACQLIRKSLYEQVEGMDEDNFAVLYNDVDLCLKIRALGHLVVWTPYANLIHHANISQMSELFQPGRAAQEGERARQEGRLMMQKWRQVISHDPSYNRNLSLAHLDMSIESSMPVNWDVNFHDRPRIIGLPLEWGSGEYRVIQPFAALSHAAVAQCETYRFSSKQSRYVSVYEYARLDPDAIVFHAAVNDLMLQQIEEVASQLPEVFRIYTIDDLLTNLPEQSSAYKTFRRHFSDIKVRIRRALKACNRLIVSTQPLAELCADMCDDIHIVPNYLPRESWTQLTSLRNQGAKPRVGWAGAQQHQGDLAIIVDVVKETADEIDWIFMGMYPEELKPYIKEYHDFVPIDEYPKKLASLNLDLALAPLEQHPFNESKSNLRLLEYGVLGWPVICTDIYPYRTDNPPVVRVDNDKESWLRAIRKFLSQPELLHQAGDALRQWVLDGYILEDHLPEWAEALNIQNQPGPNVVQ